jgi:phage antirepressor YoqD-like protein
MRIKGAMTILKKRAKFYGMTTEELVQWLDENKGVRINETIKVLQAYEVYKMDQGYSWYGVNHETWVKK